MSNNIPVAAAVVDDNQYKHDDTVVPIPLPSTYNVGQPVRRQTFQPEPSFKIPAASPNNAMDDGTLTDDQISALKSQGYTTGMAKAIAQSNVTFPRRFWVVDNSGSMAATDGNRIIASSGNKTFKMCSCTRWKEIQETVEYHAQIAGLLKSPTIFRLLNNPGARVGPQEFGVADKVDSMIPNDIQVAQQTINRATPSGVTPLVSHINHIREQVLLLKPQLSAEGRKVVIILATDGLPSNDYGVTSDQERAMFINSLRSLEGLPVWIVVRLCTNNESVVEFYNSIDAQLELSIEVLDDFTGEAEEVYEVNPWLNYTLPLHRMREMGSENRLFDLLDERPLTKSELRDFCIILFGVEKFDGVVEPEVDFPSFCKSINSMLKAEKQMYNPVKKKTMPLLDMSKLTKMYADPSEGCSIM